MYNVHLYFPLKKLGKTVHIIHGKTRYFKLCKPYSLCPALPCWPESLPTRSLTQRASPCASETLLWSLKCELHPFFMSQGGASFFGCFQPCNRRNNGWEWPGFGPRAMACPALPWTQAPWGQESCLFWCFLYLQHTSCAEQARQKCLRARTTYSLCNGDYILPLPSPLGGGGGRKAKSEEDEGDLEVTIISRDGSDKLIVECGARAVTFNWTRVTLAVSIPSSQERSHSFERHVRTKDS